MNQVTVVDYGIGNLLSVHRALAKSGADVRVATKPSEILSAERLVVPGVGAFGKCMDEVDTFGLRAALIDFARSGRPYLGICVGMQMLASSSTEFGDHSGLDLIEGRVVRIDIPNAAVPFVGWKQVDLAGQLSKFYFVHSYHVVPYDKSAVYAEYTYGPQKIVAAIRKDNLIGVQFHPEKSGTDGLRFLTKFIEGTL